MSDRKPRNVREKVKYDPFGFDKVMKEYIAKNPKKKSKKVIDKKVEPEKPKPKPKQGPPPPPKKRGRPPGAKNKPIKVRSPIRSSELGRPKLKEPKRIVMPTGRAMDEAITKIQQQLLVRKDKLKKSNGGTMNKQSQLGARLMHTIDRINRDKSLSKPQKREILKKGLKGIRKIRNMNMGGVMRGRGGTFKGVY